MNKFTIFTIILAVSVITVMADLVVRDYFDNNQQASVILSDTQTLSPVVADAPATEPPAPPPVQTPLEPPAIELPLEPPAPAFVSRITADLIAKAGFDITLRPDQFQGKVFQLLDISQIPVDDITFYTLSDKDVPIASITEIALRDEIRTLQMYLLLQNKTKPYIDLSLNETNAYGDRSFYINHAKKPAEAFLTIKLGKTLYAFAYLKTYHGQLKNLIQLLSS